MTINFIKNIFENKTDIHTHRKFVRYSLGDFEKEDFIIKVAGKNIQIQAGYEYLDTLFRFVASIIDENLDVSGIIITTKKIEKDLAEMGVEPKKITGKKYTIQEKFDPARFKAFIDKFCEYFLLLNISSASYSVKVKKSIPKPGKLVEKFMTVKLPKDKLENVKKEFLFDYEGDFKQAVIKHSYTIDEIVVPKEFKDNPEQARLNALRKGKVVRKLTIDGAEKETSAEMEV